MKAITAGVVERLEHDKTLKNFWSSTAAREISNRNSFTMPMGQDFLSRESEIAPVQQLYHYKHYKTVMYRPGVQLSVFSYLKL